MEFIIFESHAQLKILHSYIPVRILGKLLYPSFVVKNLGVWFDANFFIADRLPNICKTCLIQMHDLRWVRQYLTDEAAVLAVSSWSVVVWTTETLFSEVCPVSTCTNNSVFKTHLVGLSQIAINTQRLLLISL